MRVLIIGAGALGIATGAALCKGNIKVDFLARPATGEAIRLHGIGRSGMFQELRVAAGETAVYTDYDALPREAYDYVLITTKTTANETVAEQLSGQRGCMKQGCRILFMQNGFYYDKPFRKYFDQSCLYHSRVITGFKRNVPNESIITVHQAPILLGSLYDNPLDGLEVLAKAISDTGLQAEVSDEVGKAIWAKLIYNTTLNPLGAVLGMSYGELAASDYTRAIMDDLIGECFGIMKAAGYSTYWEDAEAYRKVFYEELVPPTAGHRSSTLQDIERKQKTEIDTLTGSLLTMAEELGLNAPTQKMLYRLIKTMEEKF